MSTNALFAGVGVIAILTYFALRGGWRQEGPFRVTALTPETGLTAVLSAGAAVYFWGVEGGIALIVTIVVHEFGHVAAYRVCGHQDARFRLVPLFGGVAISDSLPSTQARGFYISAMGPGICLVLMLAAMALQRVSIDVWPEAYPFLYFLVMISGSINFLNLLPLWPLDGGQMLRRVVYAFSPALAHYVTLAMSAAFVGLALFTQSMVILAFALMSAGSAFNAPLPPSVQTPLTRPQAVMCLVIHLTMAGAFYLGAQTFIDLYI